MSTCCASASPASARATRSATRAEHKKTRSRERPDILLILTDDVGHADTGLAALTGRATASDLPDTPNLNALASAPGSLLLDSFYVQPLCSASRAALLTGRYPINTGMQTHVLQPQQRGGLPLVEATLAEGLKARGYATHLVGKWHLGYSRWVYTPRRRGFDSFFGMYTGASDHLNHRISTTNNTVPDKGPLAGPFDLRRDESPVRHSATHPTHGVHSSDLYADEAVAVLGRHAAERAEEEATPARGSGTHEQAPPPYFLMLSFQAAHDPIQTPAGWAERNAHIADPQRRELAGLVSHLDAATGRVLAAAKLVGWSRTLVLYCSDNGGVPYLGSSNFPWRGAKGGLWEGSVRTQLLVGGGALLPQSLMPSSSPIVPSPPQTLRFLAHVTDLFPTIMAAADATSVEAAVAPDAAGGKPLDGVSLWPQLQAAASGSTSAARLSAPRSELLLNIDDVGYPLLPAPRLGTTPRYQLRKTLARTLGWADRCAALRLGKYKLLIGSPGVPFAPMPVHGTSSAAEAMAAGMAGAGSLLAPAARASLDPLPAPLASIDRADAFAGWEPQAWLFDLEADPSESINLLLETLTTSSPSPSSSTFSNGAVEENAEVARRMLTRLAELRAGAVSPPVNAYGTFSHGWREHVGFFPPRHAGFVAPYEEPDVPLRGAWLAYATFGTILLLALLVLPLLPLVGAVGCTRKGWRMLLRSRNRGVRAHAD